MGRFITPDTIIPSPSNPQSLNRYSYCDNNPVNFSDPTGHKSWWSKFWKGLVSNGIGAIVGGIVFGVLTGGAGFTLSAAIWAGAAGGAVAGGLSAGLNGGNIGLGILMGGAMGAVGGAVFGPIGNSLYNSFGIAGVIGLAAGASIAQGAISGDWAGAAGGFVGGLAGGYLGAKIGAGINQALNSSSAGQSVQEGRQVQNASGANTPIGAQRQTTQSTLTVGQQEDVVNGQALSEPSNVAVKGVGQIDGIPAQYIPKAGDPVYRVYDTNLHGTSWTPIDPRTVPNFAQAAGLYNSGGHLAVGTLLNADNIMVRAALPGPTGEGGGLVEWVIPNSRSQVGNVSVSDYSIN